MCGLGKISLGRYFPLREQGSAVVSYFSPQFSPLGGLRTVYV